MPIIPPNPLIPASLFVALLFVLAWSLRRRRVDDHPVCRRRVDDHPVCRRCGFDLTGRPAGSSVCSECGADLNRRRAIRHGNRVRRWRVARWMAVPLLLSVAWLGASRWAASHGMDSQAAKPLWWLKLDARSKDPVTRDAAVTEFIRRLSLQRLSDAQVTALADQALDLQADPARAWTPLWGQFVEDAFDAGRLSLDRWERYARQSFDFALDFRKQVRRGEPLLARIALRQPRTGRPRLVADAYGFRLDGEKRISYWYEDSRRPAYADWPYLAILNGPGRKAGQWPGKYRGNRALPIAGFGLAAVIDPSRFDWSALGPRSNSVVFDVDVWDPRSAKRVTTFPVALQSAWTMLPSDVPSVTLRHDASLRAAVQGSVAAHGVNMEIVRHGPDGRTYAMRADVHLVSTPTPVALAFEVWLRRGSAEYKLEEQLPQVFRAGERVDFYPHGLFPARLSTPDLATEFGQPGATVDVILRPTGAPAVMTSEVLEIWGEDIVFRNVPVAFNAGAMLSRD